jgi:hypothetical protein
MEPDNPLLDAFVLVARPLAFEGDRVGEVVSSRPRGAGTDRATARRGARAADPGAL